MESDLILSNVAKHISLNQSAVKYFLSLLKIERLQKKEYILKAGEHCTAISYVNSGTCRSFYRDKDLNESTIMFAVNDWWITDMPSFVNKNPASIWIEAIEDSSIYKLSKDNFDLLLVEVPKFEKFFRILMQNAYIREQLRFLQNLSLPAEERYINFLKNYPTITKTVTQKNIATYLGITPEFLSSLRNKISKGVIS